MPLLQSRVCGCQGLRVGDRTVLGCCFTEHRSVQWASFLWSSSWAPNCITGAGSERYVLLVGGCYINHFCIHDDKYAAGANPFLLKKLRLSLQQLMLLPSKQSEPVGYFWGSFTFCYFLQWVGVFFYYFVSKMYTCLRGVVDRGSLFIESRGIRLWKPHCN